MIKQYLMVDAGTNDDQIRLITTDDPSKVTVRIGGTGVQVSIEELKSAINECEAFVNSSRDNNTPVNPINTIAVPSLSGNISCVTTTLSSAFDFIPLITNETISISGEGGSMFNFESE